MSPFKANKNTAQNHTISGKMELISCYKFLKMSHKITHIFCVRKRWNCQNCSFLTILKSQLTSLRFYGAGGYIQEWCLIE